MKRTFASLAAVAALTACSDIRGTYPYQSSAPAGTRAQAVNLSPAHRAAADARKSPGFVATPAPKFSGAGTPQPTHGWFPPDRSRSRSSYNYYGNPYGYPGGYYRY